MGQKSRFLTETSCQTKLPDQYCAQHSLTLSPPDVDVPHAAGVGVAGDGPRPLPGLPALPAGPARAGCLPLHPGGRLSQPQPRPAGWPGRRPAQPLPPPRHPRHHRLRRGREGEQSLSDHGEKYSEYLANIYFQKNFLSISAFVYSTSSIIVINVKLYQIVKKLNFLIEKL